MVVHCQTEDECGEALDMDVVGRGHSVDKSEQQTVDVVLGDLPGSIVLLSVITPWLRFVMTGNVVSGKHFKATASA